MTTTVSADIAYAVQEAIVETLVASRCAALEATGTRYACRLRRASALTSSCATACAWPLPRVAAACFYPRFEFCTDNAAMIAVAGMRRLAAGQHAGLEIAARAQWPLDTLEAL